MRTPPPCGSLPVAFINSKLVAGDVGTTRRPREPVTIASKSMSESKPSNDNANPFCPRALPWHAPALQPRAVKIGWMSSSNFGVKKDGATMEESVAAGSTIDASSAKHRKVNPVNITTATHIRVQTMNDDRGPVRCMERKYVKFWRRVDSAGCSLYHSWEPSERIFLRRKIQENGFPSLRR